MPQTAAPLIGSGITMSIGTQGATPAYTPISGLTKVTPPPQKFGTTDTTTLTTGYKKVMKTIPDYGEVTIEGIYESADPGQIALAAAFGTLANSTNGGDYPFEIQMPPNLAGGQTATGDLVKFVGPVTEFATDQESAEKEVTFKATIKVNAMPVVTLGS
jgi:hypothetical protein